MEVEMKPIREEEGGDEELDIFPLEEGASVLRDEEPEENMESPFPVPSITAEPLPGVPFTPTDNWKVASVKEILWDSVIIENKGSLARDHLANERTFLAWFRTSMGCSAIGFTLCVFLKEGQNSTAAGVMFILMGLLFLCFASYRYYKSLFLLNLGRFEANKFGVLSLIVIGAFLVVGAVLYMISTLPSSQTT